MQYIASRSKLEQKERRKINTNNADHYTLFISDLHLQATQPKTAQAFVDFMQHRAPQADALYILGDLFDAWLGDDDRSDFNQSIMNTLQQTSQQGLPIYLMQGNRDFLLGQSFAKACSLTLLPDPCLITLYDNSTPILLTHGDNLCTFDHLHQYWFKLTRHRFNQSIAKAIPLNWRRALARWLRQQSRRHQSAREDYQLDVSPTAVNQLMQRYQTPLMIHGHTHQPAIHSLDDNQHRIVLGAWHQTAAILKYHADNRYQLETLSL